MHTVLQRAWCFACIPSGHANEEYSSFVTPLRSALLATHADGRFRQSKGAGQYVLYGEQASYLESQ